MSLIDLITGSPIWRQPALLIVANIVVMAAFVLIAAAVILDFRAYHHQDRAVVSSDRSLVETGSMTAFFVAYYLVARFRVGEMSLAQSVRYPLIVVGIVLIVVGVAVNVWGRLALKSFWANQIKIYEGHRLLTHGPFAVARHPLYASLIWTFVGGALVYANALALALTLGVFVPMMYVRAKKEDALLAENFPGEHAAYKARTWMFLPKPWR